jgi:hypothetical protein
MMKTVGLSGHLLRGYSAQPIGAVLGAKAPGTAALGFPPRRRHPLGIPTPIYFTLHDSIDLSTSAAISLH